MKYLCSFILLFSALAGRAQTMLGGTISRDTTWTKAHSPYLVVDDIVVDTNVRLTIEPGVRLMFKLNKHLLVQYGTLTAIGTKTDSIDFSSENASDQWFGVYLMHPARPVQLSYCRFSNAEKALVLSTSFDSATLEIRNSLFQNNTLALELFDSSSRISVDSTDFDQNAAALQNNFTLKNFSMGDCRFSNNRKATSNLKQNLSSAKAPVRNCLFYKNQIAGEFQSNISFSHCVFTRNDYAIYTSTGYCSYTACDIDSSTYTGIHTSNDSVVNCRFRANSGGLAVEKGSYIAQNIFEHNENALGSVWGNKSSYMILENQFRNNGFAGNIRGGTFTKNIIEDNNRGLNIDFLDTAKGLITCNKLCGADSVVILSPKTTITAAVVDLTRNYWCGTDSATIAGIIIDQNELSSLARAVFMPVDITECYKPVSVPELPNDPAAIKVYPNPAGDFITVNGINATAMLDIYAPDGKRVCQAPVVPGSEQVGVSSLVPGLYFIRITTAGGLSATSRFVKL